MGGSRGLGGRKGGLMDGVGRRGRPQLQNRALTAAGPGGTVASQAAALPVPTAYVGSEPVSPTCRAHMFRTKALACTSAAAPAAPSMCASANLG